MAKESSEITSLIKDLKKKHGLSIGSFSEVVKKTIGLSTGNIGIDYVAGVGGMPQGRMTELYGLPSSGKTTTALQAAAGLQKRIIAEGTDEYILYLDFEHALDLDYAGDLGLNLEHPSFVLAQPNWLEQGAEIGLTLIGTGKVRMSIWDSVAAMTPKVLLDGDFDQRTAAMNRARLMSGLCQRLVALIDEQNCAVVMINHLMEAVEITGGGRPGMPPKATTPGGKAVKYYSSLRLEYRQIKNTKGKQSDALTGATTEQISQTLVKVKCVKNKVANPFREVEVLSRFGMGFDNFWSALQVLLAHNEITTASTGRYYFPADLIQEHMETAANGQRFIRGEQNLLAFADLHDQWRAQVIDKAASIVDAYGPQVIDTRTDGTDLDLDGLGPDLEELDVP
jgi:recombination protein RecA